MLRQLQIKSVASHGNLCHARSNPALSGTELRGVLRSSPAPHPSPVPKPLLGQPAPAWLGVPVSPCTHSLAKTLPALGCQRGAGHGWGVVSTVLFAALGWLHWASAAPTTAHEWEWAGCAPTASPSIRLWGFSRKSKTNEPLWGWKYLFWWERGCLVHCGLGCSLLGSPEDAGVG